MEQIKYNNQKVTVEVDDGYTISKTKTMRGRLSVDEDNCSMSFKKDKEKVKQSTRNIPVFTGDNISLIPNKDGRHHLNMYLASDTQISKVLEDLVAEFKEALSHMPVQ